jgi:hypothetical protein
MQTCCVKRFELRAPPQQSIQQTIALQQRDKAFEIKGLLEVFLGHTPRSAIAVEKQKC